MSVAAKAQPLTKAPCDPAEIDADAFIDRMIGLGWEPWMVLHADGRPSFGTRLLSRPSDLVGPIERSRLEKLWLGTAARRDAVKIALDVRGLLYRAA
ncbi:hypothetical protein E9232_004915 [Inquilinus ginsengisoli]|uniref:Uncharacterized protein n=1 Tax=Inquilinus ginsengisoli TaxID=363840 RepID=A0ABU1JUS1_9PROT|nr:hypothetical protein [Inquilinus ginsengisoli]MDR6292375.1 hypothetical protein [Inquilinus ginsengisoli]